MIVSKLNQTNTNGTSLKESSSIPPSQGHKIAKIKEDWQEGHHKEGR